MTEQNEFEQLDCSAVIADVWLMLDNECDERARARIKKHMEDCGSCFEAYGIEAKVKSMIARKCGGEHAPDGLRERLRIQLSQTTIVTRIDPGQ